MRAGALVDDEAFEAIRRSMVLRHFKWDAQVGDSNVLARFPLLLPRREWEKLAGAAEALTREMFAAEEQVVGASSSHDDLGVPKRIRPLVPRLVDAGTPSVGRIVRFDFHPTRDGWRVSEANSDTPGGFTESSTFSSLMGSACGRLPAGDPAAVWLRTIARHEDVALLVAPGWLEDMQVVAYLARGLRDLGCRAEIVTPHQLEWDRARAIVRFFQVEWLAELPRHLRWDRFFVNGGTPVANPGICVVSESKRFPIASARAGLEIWKEWMPESRDPRDVQLDDGWVLKPAFCNTGEEIKIRSEMSSAAWARLMFHVRLRPRNWVAQRRFESLAIDTPEGPRHACVGVYTIDGRAVGAYARISTRSIVDGYATDAAVLVE